MLCRYAVALRGFLRLCSSLNRFVLDGQHASSATLLPSTPSGLPVRPSILPISFDDFIGAGEPHRRNFSPASQGLSGRDIATLTPSA
jgi:hypothetical protein